ncbi:Class E vacuolar protein-sorting machinery protein HSE1 [Vanrija pseudolonga]|uniref:Class E vacuolar protein-sorting machinery protein HSE1 n=1 Tax=Vanrija pseudolonga TaxID=143232 RepID=A0AAF0Y355_9TREE|nr:Class E vacuolar protein-sorting machinery protein HSE1 [Vanrija pseudolonga]
MTTMFSAAANPYDEIVTKATDENLASEDWDINLQVCDKVTEEGTTGARNAIAALTKRLAHRNPNVQIYALELTNTLAQNCGQPLLEEMSSRTWTGALSRLVNDRATVQPVQRKALKYIKEWARQFEEKGDPNLGLMGELYDQLRAKNFTFDDSEPVPENQDEVRRRREEEELARVIELSKQDVRGAAGRPYQPSQPGVGSSAAAAAAAPPEPVPQPQQHQQHWGAPAPAAAPHSPSQAQRANTYPQQQQQPAAQPYAAAVAPAPEPEPEGPVDINTATRVRALYTFTSEEVGELNFERGDIIKVLDRGFQEWWRGASNGKIGIFPVTYVEALPEPSSRELQEEAQQEARVFASLGLVDQLLQTLKGIDTTRGDRLEDRPEVEEMYQASVDLQGQINALIKKYSDQKAELEHMNANFIRAMRQYEELKGVPAVPAQAPYYAQQGPHADPYAQPQQQPPPQHDPYAQQQQQPPTDPYYAQQQQQGQYPQQQPYAPQAGQPPAQSPPVETPQQHAHYYQQHQGSTTSLQPNPTGAPGFPTEPQRQNTNPGAAGIGAGSDPAADHAAAWEAYYRQQGQQAQQPGQQPAPQQQAPQQQQPGQAPQQYPFPQQAAAAGAQAYSQPGYPQHGGVDGVAAGVGRLSVGGQQ